MTETKQPRVGGLQVADYAEYGEGRTGFIIEQFGYWGGSEPSWALPAWDERGDGELCGPFATRGEAERALSEAR